MNDNTRMRVGNSVADRDEGVQQCQKFQGFRLASCSISVIQASRLGQRSTLDKAHGIERLFIVRSHSQFVDGYDTWVLQLTSDPCLPKKPARKTGGVGLFWTEFL